MGISNGVEWYGRVPKYEPKAKEDQTLNERDDEDCEDGIAFFGGQSLSSTETEEEKQEVPEEKEQTLVSSKHSPHAATDVAAIRSKNSALSHMLKKTFSSPEQNDEPDFGNKENTVIN